MTGSSSAAETYNFVDPSLATVTLRPVQRPSNTIPVITSQYVPAGREVYEQKVEMESKLCAE